MHVKLWVILIFAVLLILALGVFWQVREGRLSFSFSTYPPPPAQSQPPIPLPPPSPAYLAPLPSANPPPLPSPAYLVLSSTERMDLLRKNGTVVAMGDPANGGVEIYTPTLILSSTPCDRTKLDGARALDVAAYRYAVFTLDFEVSMKDLLDSGLWPYMSFHHDFDIDAPIELDMAAVASECLPLDYLAALDTAPHALAHSRRSVLMNFYKGFFFPEESGDWLDANLTINGALDMGMPLMPESPLKGMMPKKPAAKSENDLPPRISHFWQRADGSGPLEFGDEIGDLIYVDANCYRGAALFAHQVIKRDYKQIPVPALRGQSKAQQATEKDIESLFELPPPQNAQLP